MTTIPFIGNDTGLFASVEKTIQETPPHDSELIRLSTLHQAVEYLNIEMPELSFVYFAEDDSRAFGLLDTIMSDPWLLHGGIIALCNNYDMVTKLDGIKGANFVVILTRDELPKHLPRVMNIINNNRRILFQREIGSDIVRNISGSFQLHNDTFEASCYANLICNFLYNCNRLDIEQKDLLNFSLNEMLLNAIEHGNCGITSREKSDWLEKGGSMLDLIESKCNDPAVAERTVTFEYSITPTHSRFVITDLGDGFDWRNSTDSTAEENTMKLHGRGIMVTRKFTQNMTYNEKGNQVSFDFSHRENLGLITPALFSNIDPEIVPPQKIVFREGEPSNFLYYIVKGAYDVYANGNKVSTLSEDDVFMGEMSFLLNNRRSATVIAATEGKLIKVSKKDFVEAVKLKPHYALFLSRLLAQRIQRSNINSAASEEKKRR
ncbi:MAG: cyclic nucleotide-binding domain-containing protein [Chitinivibrionales bacterium]|nr:cyclic nucleotide-binding domain-containing protein [Chitinivibrionales bacterium]